MIVPFPQWLKNQVPEYARLGTRIVRAVYIKSEGWGLVIFDWLVLSMRI